MTAIDISRFTDQLTDLSFSMGVYVALSGSVMSSLWLSNGGVVTDFKGGEDYIFGREIVAGGAIHPELLKVIKTHW